MLNINWKYGQFGPGGGSIPGAVMRTGQIMPFDPKHVRHDIESRFIQDAVNIPVSHQPSPMLYPQGGDQPVPGMGPPMPPAATAEQNMKGTLLGADPQGRPVRQFKMTGSPSSHSARAVTAAFKQAARQLIKTGLLNALPRDLMGAPLMSLASGEVVVLKWPNGVAVSTRL